MNESNDAQEAISLLKEKAFKGMTNKDIEIKCELGNGTLGSFEKTGRTSWATIEKLAKGAGKKAHLVFKRDSK